MAQIDNRILLINEKGRKWAVKYNLDGVRGDHAKWIESEKKTITELSHIYGE